MTAALLISACGKVENTASCVSNSEDDNKYIDLVYNNIENWDITREDSGKTFSIDRISFYNFENSGQIAFYINYPNKKYSIIKEAFENYLISKNK